MSKSRGTVLVAEDQAGVRSFLVAVLEDEGHRVIEAEDGIAAIRALDKAEVDVVLTDLKMPGADGMAVLSHARTTQPDASVIVLTAFGSIENAVDAMRHGASDYLTKPVDSPSMLALAVERALKERRLRAENERLRREAPPTRGFDGVVRGDERTEQVVRMAQAVAPTDSTVLLLGESGVGKEVYARAIHDAAWPGQKETERPFVAINCAALPRDLLESELFGHEKGAFTGAQTQRKGRFELARGGTLFLDEVGEMEIGLQAKLLRVLQEGTFERVGGTRTLQFDGRIVAATNRDLRDQVQEGRFREDLYYRLNVFPIRIPPLRERPGDILPLARHTLAGLAARRGGRACELTPEAEELLVGYDWPGNVRELGNILERAVILSSGSALGRDCFPPELAGGRHHADADDDGPRTLQEMEREAILEALERHDGNRKQVAAELGISLRTLQYRLREYGLTRR